ncbi:MAG: hypothetical protein CSA38_05325 [Flavobacteriales bacterium]|nr:MAG: hypothetical protein CSA38_05325 [Flavobacteriales bacterium]
MNFASFKQNVQDWFTQQWVILSGKKINSKDFQWLLAPFGNTNEIGQKFIHQLQQDENLETCKSTQSKGLISSIDELNLSSTQRHQLSKNVIDFYENTSDYELHLTTKWNPFFKAFGYLLKLFFSNRIEQLNIPLDSEGTKEITSEIIQLRDMNTQQLKRTIWLRAFKATKQIVYSGIYETCTLPSGITCIKAVFPLPNGNATVILEPSIGNNGALILTSAGKKIGDSGFYFLLKDKKGNLWTKYIKSFKDTLMVYSENGKIKAHQTLTFYGFKVVNFEYEMKSK